MKKSNLSWPLLAAVGALGLGGALFAPACTVTSSTDDDVDVDAGSGGSSAGGSKGSGGTAGSSSGGSGTGGGSAGSGTSGGSGGSDGGSGGSTGGSAGGGQVFVCEDDTVLPWPNCNEDDTDDGCTACLKTQCCDAWRDCFASDTSGDFICGWGGPTGAGEFGCIADCMRNGAADTGECIGTCQASEWMPAPECAGGTITLATNGLLDCLENEGSDCQAECYE